jgi:homoserine dehydrogenase
MSKNFNIAILGCGTVGSGVAKILLDLDHDLHLRAQKKIVLKKIVDLFPSKSAKQYQLPLNLFCGGGKDLTKEEASAFTKEVLEDKEIDLVVETIGGTSDYLFNVMISALKNGKHMVTANKAMLAERGEEIFNTAIENNVSLGYEASVCGAIPVIKAIRESFTGDKVLEISGIMNGTSNYILSKMKEDGLSFDEALSMAQKAGYAEADPTLDISGGDAAHKLTILLRLAFGAQVKYDHLYKEGINTLTKDDLDLANEMNCTLKLICYAKQTNQKIYAAVRPMMVKNDNLLSKVSGATNCVEILNQYSGKHHFVGKGAGSLETASSIVGDIIFAARYDKQITNIPEEVSFELADADNVVLPYNITFITEDYPGITGLVTTAIGRQQINIDTVSHNRHTPEKSKAVFSIATMPCTLSQIKKAIVDIKTLAPNVMKEEPKIIPILN